ncbi:MAG: CRISPR-associated endoribonuclease Cas2 [Pirellulaceae bacterium]|nr:MAG: CRISPR-associated endoribonuclease Cas2 [Pirellulaceae bacterium]
MYIVVAYDVVLDRRRTRLAKRLKGFLQHVQKSVFEGDIAEERLEELRAIIWNEIDPSEDSVRIYHLCQRCIPLTEVMGQGIYVETEADEVI